MPFLASQQKYNSIGAKRSSGLWILMLLGLLFAVLMGGIAGLFGGLPVLFLMLFLIFGGYSLLDYRVGVVVASFLLPLATTTFLPHEIGGVKGLNPLNLLIVISVFSLLATSPFRSVKLVIPTLERPFWLYIGALIFAGIWGALHVSQKSIFFPTTFDNAVGYMRDVVLRPLITLGFIFLMSIVVANARRPALILVSIFSSAILLPVAVIILVAVSGLPLSVLASSASRSFLSRFGMHANEFGLLFNTVFALSVFCLFGRASRLGKFALAGVAGLALLGVLLTFSRGALLGTMVVVMYFLFTQRRLKAMIGTVIFVVIAAYFMPKAVVERASTNVSGGNVSEISAGRVQDIWMPLLPEVVRSPLIGRGMSSILWSDALRNRTIPSIGHPHNAYLGLLMDFGLIGAAIVFLFFRHMWRFFNAMAEAHHDSVWKGYFNGATACILVLLVQGMTDDRFSPTASQTFLWISYGIALGMSARRPKVAPPVVEQSRSNNVAQQQRVGI